MEPARRAWVRDLLIGGVLGAVGGAIVAVNVVIYSGIEGGYENSIPDVFRHSAVLGVVVVAVLAAGPIVGVAAARRYRRRKEAAAGESPPQ